MLSLWLFFAAYPCFSQADNVRKAAELIHNGHSEQARKLLLEALQGEPKNESIHELLARIEFHRKNYAASIHHFKQAPSIVAQDPELVLQFAEALLETNSPSEAKRLLDTLPAANAGAQFKAGLLSARFGGYTSAENHFRLASTSYPDQLAVGYNIALAQYNAGKFKECSKTLEELHHRGVKSDDVLILLAEAYVQSGELQRALDSLSEVAKDNPHDARSYLLAADIYDEAEKPMIGLNVIDQALQHLPQSYVLLLERGYLNLVLTKLEAAEADYRSALALRPGSASAQMGLAFVFLQSGRESEATSLLEDGVQSKHAGFFAHYLLGDIYLRGGHNAKALSQLEKALELNPDFAAAHTDLGKLYLKKNQVSSAIRELEKAVSLDPEDVTAFYQLSVVYRSQGLIEKTNKALEEVQRLNKKQGDLGMGRFLTQSFRVARRAALAQRDF